jgi:opacity protein-like surface antigen
MKKNLFYTIFTLLIYSNLSSQGNLYIGAQTGFHFQTNPTNVDFLVNFNNNFEEKKSFTLGGGFRGGILMGFLISDNIGFELGINYQQGNKVSFLRTNNSMTDEANVQNNSIQFTPSILINPGLEFINPYAKFGLLITSNETNMEYISKNMNGVRISDYKFTGGLSFGFYSALGVSIPLSENINLFSEISYNMASFSPSTGSLEAASIDGNAVNVRLLRNSERYISFVDKVELNAPTDPDQPVKFVSTNFSISSVGLCLGTRIFF